MILKDLLIHQEKGVYLGMEVWQKKEAYLDMRVW